jgi:tRNA-(ms[2]io[6]A)-hydroxylase
MIALHSTTDPRWVEVALANFEAVLVDHAHCEKKAAASAMALVNRYPEKTELVRRCVKLAQEELRHFQQVHDRIRKRGIEFTRDGGDPYVKRLRSHLRPDGTARLTDLLLVSALIEGRSYERLCLLGEHLPDEGDRAFYSGLAQSEAGHYHLFLDLAKRYDDPDAVEARFKELADHEAAIVASRPIEPRVH